MGLPMVTMSGTMPWRVKPQSPAPVRPKPGCTSSAMNSPLASCTAFNAVCRKPGGSAKMPSEEKMLSTTSAAKPMPASSSSAMAARRLAANTPATSPVSCGAGMSRTCGCSGAAEKAEGEMAVTAVVLP